MLYPQTIHRELRALAKRELGEELLGRFAELCRARDWHPTDQCAVRRFAAFMCAMDLSKPYNWSPKPNARYKTRAQRLAPLGGVIGGGGHTFGMSVRGVGQEFWAQLLAAGDGVPVDRSTVREVFLDLHEFGLVATHQPPRFAKLPPYERNGKWAFNHYWLRMAGQEIKPALRGVLDTVTDWAERIASWFDSLAPARASPPVPF